VYVTQQIQDTISVGGFFKLEGTAIETVTANLVVEDEIYVYGILNTSVIIGSGSSVVGYASIWNPFLEPVVDGMKTTLFVTGLTTYPASSASGVLVQEAFERVLAKNLSTSNRFKSSYYGRTDRGYAADGLGSLRSIHSGKCIRGFDVIENPIFSNFKELFESLQAIDGIGVGIEKIDGVEKVVVEKINYFYNNTRSVRIPFVRDIEKEVADEYYYNELGFTYPNWSNEFINNLDEFNAPREFTLPITQVKKKLTLISTLIASGYTIEFVRRDSVLLSSSRDNDRDSNNFIIQLIRNMSGYEPERNAGIGLSNVIDPSSVYNARLSPMRSILRNGSLIRSGLHKRDDQQITLAFGEANTRFKSTETGGVQVSENAMPVASLDKPIWIPEYYKFKAPLSQAQIDAIEANIYGYVEFAVDDRSWKKGYLLELSPDSKSDLTNFKLLKANL
jgi:hypothetical protein